MTQAEFAKGMILLNAAYSKFEANQTVIEVWYSFFEDVRADSFIAAVKTHIRESSFPPKINELLKQCEIQGANIQNDILKFMYESRYFHKPDLSDADASKNYQKSLAWVERNTAPEWLKNDMRECYKLKLAQKGQTRIEG